MNLIVLGSQNSNPEDREIERDEICGFQIYTDGNFIAVDALDNKEKLGVSSLCFKNNRELYCAYVDNFKKINVDSGTIEDVNIQCIKDIHEISYIHGRVWLSNTYYDEVVSYQEGVIDRINLRDIVDTRTISFGGSNKEKFHCNQVFKGFDEDLYVLVHHYNGKQFLNKVRTKILKSHGNGGVINLKTGEGINLKLKAPHTVRKINGSYWVFNSGDRTIKIFGEQWDFIEEVEMMGWGRGGDLSQDGSKYFCGVSSTRKRYRFKTKNVILNNYIQVFDIENRTPISEIEVPAVEQVNNIYTISEETRDGILKNFASEKAIG